MFFVRKNCHMTFSSREHGSVKAPCWPSAISSFIVLPSHSSLCIRSSSLVSLSVSLSSRSSLPRSIPRLVSRLHRPMHTRIDHLFPPLSPAVDHRSRRASPAVDRPSLRASPPPSAPLPRLLPVFPAALFPLSVPAPFRDPVHPRAGSGGHSSAINCPMRRRLRRWWGRQ